MKRTEQHNKQPSITINTAAFEEAKATPYYTCSNDGIYYHTFTTDKHGAISEDAPLRLSDMIRLIGRGTDDAGNHYRVIEWKDRLNHETHTDALPMADIGSSWGRLQGMGIAIHANRRKRELLADYLQSEGSNTAYAITNRAGWHKGSYILPSGDILTADNKAARTLYNGDKSQAPHYTTAGELTDWQQHIARFAMGNSRLCLALGTAFAAPLMRLLDIEGGGFHLYGDSSDGKTTAAKVALSVWGKPDDLKLSWEGTSYAFTNTANAHNDGLIILDEIGQAAPRVVARTAYSIFNGTSKQQGKAEGGNRQLNRWRVLVLSTGEKTMHGYLKSGGTDWQAGQANRMPSIPANAGKGLGVFDTLHDFDNGADMAEHLNHTANQYYGTAGRAFIAKLLTNPEAATKHAWQTMQAFTAALPALSGQARRVGNRFAMVAAALELADHWGIIDNPTATASIKQCFDDWYSINGSGKYEDTRIIEQAEAFMQQHADGWRFDDWSKKGTSPEHAGYTRFTFQELKTQNATQGKNLKDDELTALQEYWIIPKVFENEICQGFDIAKVCAVLHGIEWLRPSMEGNRRRWKHKRYGKGRYYVLVGIEPPEQSED